MISLSTPPPRLFAGFVKNSTQKGAFMLNIIEPKHHSLYQEKVDSLLGLLKVYQDFSLPLGEPNKAIFIIAEDEMRGIYGGAVLYRQVVKELHELISKELLIFLPEDEKVWCSCLCFCPDEKEKIAIEAIELCETFYSEIYEALGELGKKKNTEPIAKLFFRVGSKIRLSSTIPIF
jgi:hypothetical protein